MPGDPPLAADPEDLPSGQAESAVPPAGAHGFIPDHQPVPAPQGRVRVRRRGLKQLAVATALAAVAFTLSYALSRNGDDPAAFDLPEGTTSSVPSSPSQSAATSTTRTATATGPNGALAKPRRVHWHFVKSAMCIRLPNDVNGVEYLTVVDCRAEHHVEVIGRAAISGPKKWPGDEVISVAALDRCKRAFEPYVGLSYDKSRLEVDYVTADVQGWNAGDRTLICLVFDPDHETITRALGGTAE